MSDGTLSCRRCGRPVIASASQFDTFEHMHYVCFHYEFEHCGDPDVVCDAGGCPAAGVSRPSRIWMRDGVDIVQAGDTIVPAILVLERFGFTVEQHAGRFVARTAYARFSAEDPVNLLGLITLADERRPWRATDEEIDRVVLDYDL